MPSSPHPTPESCLRRTRCPFVSALIWWPCSPGSFQQRQLRTSRYPFRRERQSTPAGSLFSIAPPVDSLDVFGMIVPPRSSHSTGIDVVRNDVVIVRELSLAEGTYSILGGDLPIDQLSHLAVRADLPVSPRMLGIVNAANAHLARSFSFRDGFPSAACQ